MEYRITFFCFTFIITSTIVNSFCYTGTELAEALHEQWGGHYFSKQKPEKSLTFFSHIATHSPYHRFSLCGQIETLFHAEQYEKVISFYIKHKKELEPHIEVKKMYALSLYKTDSTHKELDTLFFELNKALPMDTEIGFYAINAYMNNNLLSDALRVTELLLNSKSSHPSDFIFHFLHAQIHMRMKQNSQAKHAVAKALECNPEFDKGWLLFSVLAELEEQWEEAVTSYRTYLSFNNDPLIRQHMLELAFAQKQVSPQKTLYKQSKDTFRTALSFIKRKNYAQALPIIEQCLVEHPFHSPYILCKIEILIHTHQYSVAASYLSKLLSQSDSVTKQKYWSKIIHLIARKKREFIPFAVSIFQEKKVASQTFALLYLADLFLYTAQWKEAEHTLSNLYTHIQKEETFLLPVMHQLSLTYFMQKKYDAALNTLEKLLNVHPHHIPSLNLCAHLYTVYKKDYIHAEKLIAKARALDPHDPHLIDTHAHIFYKQKAYKDAKELLDIAHKIAPKDATILLHRAQIAFKQEEQSYAHTLVEEAQQYIFNENERTLAQKIMNKHPRQDRNKTNDHLCSR